MSFIEYMSQCQCITAKGTQCSRNASTGSKFCFQHQNCQKIVPGSARVATTTATPIVTAKVTTATAPIVTAKAATIARAPIVMAKAKPFVANVPTAVEINEINRTIKRINELVEANQEIEELYVDLPSIRKYQLTMDDVKNIEQNRLNRKGGKKFFMIEPQTYDEMREFGHDLEMFYEDSGKAVTGSGSDLWILYKPGLLNDLKSIAKRYESLPSMTIANRRKILGDDMYSKASTLLLDPEGRRLRAIRATRTGYPTDQATASGLCNDLKSDLYMKELLELAEDLDLPIDRKYITKSELCKMIAQYAEEADIPIPERVDEKIAEKVFKKIRGVSEKEAADNLARFESLSWVMGDRPEEAYELIDTGETTMFKEFPVNIESDIGMDRNILDQGQLDLVISNDKIIIDWINANGDDEELVVKGPVTYRKVWEAINNSLQKFADENDTTVEDIVGSGHVYWEGFTPVKGKPGHWEAHFGS